MTDKEKLEKIKSLSDKMHDTAFNITTDASLLKKAMDEYHQFIINEYHKEEQVIKELQKEPIGEKKCIFTKDSYTDEDRKVFCEDCKERCAYAIAGVISTNAQIKKEPVSEELEEAIDEYAPDFSNSIASKAAVDAVRDAFKTGAKWKEQQMTENTIDAQCFGFQGDALFSFRLPSNNYLVGSKVKVIVIKKDEL